MQGVLKNLKIVGLGLVCLCEIKLPRLRLNCVLYYKREVHVFSANIHYYVRGRVRMPPKNFWASEIRAQDIWVLVGLLSLGQTWRALLVFLKNYGFHMMLFFVSLLYISAPFVISHQPCSISFICDTLLYCKEQIHMTTIVVQVFGTTRNILKEYKLTCVLLPLNVLAHHGDRISWKVSWYNSTYPRFFCWTIGH